MTTQILYDHDLNLLSDKKYKHIIGIDEAGRGPLAGPVVIAAVIMDYQKPIEGLDDSKKLSDTKRLSVGKLVKERALSVESVHISETIIDRMNILRATLMGMQQLINRFCELSDYIILVDGNIIVPDISPDRIRTIVKDDGTSAAIAAASVIAKIERDKIMKKYSDIYPLYKFNENKGYGTKTHITALKKNGMCPIHRKTFCS